jgi:uncharacterized protein YdbL (DUF1318 family)
MKYAGSAKLLVLLIVAVFFVPACKTEHKVAVETPQPIKIEARVDIYLHAESIEDMVKGKAPIPEAQSSEKPKESMLNRILNGLSPEKEAFAQEPAIKNFTDQIRAIVLRRKDRYPQIEQLIGQGKVKEGPKGYLVVTGGLGGGEQGLVDAENQDRRQLYTEIASQNGLTLQQVEEAFGRVHGN